VIRALPLGRDLMDIRSDRGTVIGKISAGIIANATGRPLGHVRDGNVLDPSLALVGRLRKGSIVGADGAEKALYERETLSTPAGTIMYQFSRTAVLDPDGFPVLGLSEDCHAFMDELVSYIVFFSDLWRARAPPILYPYLHPGFY
jgi:hypothetical protein